MPLRIKNNTKKHNIEVLRNVKKHMPRLTMKAMLFIVNRYLYYSVLSAMHGVKTCIARKCWFSLKYRYWEDGVPEMNSSLTSQIFGIEFYYCINGYLLEKWGYHFVQGENIKKIIEEHIDQDHIYDLIR